ncbi:hypothetical protein BSU04_10265 [Caballeronia sordidicola]|uniref:Uncharacterized protein n=2 Tax=Caballeronia sordidicola TaxID=196367 RepID=A0A226X6Y2_CABSO|nr:hypothetical protein BSU04_10265 [Caballeronia sordidicola]
MMAEAYDKKIDQTPDRAGKAYFGEMKDAGKKNIQDLLDDKEASNETKVHTCEMLRDNFKVSFPLFFVFQGSNIMPPDSSPAESRSSLA